MKIIDLIGLLISNETMPKHIIFEEEEYCWDSSANDYICNDHDATQLFNNQYNMSNLPLFLGKTLEILEEEKKIPEKSILDIDSDVNGSYDTVIINGAEYQISRVERYILGKINEICDYLKSKGE